MPSVIIYVYTDIVHIYIYGLVCGVLSMRVSGLLEVFDRIAAFTVKPLYLSSYKWG